MSLVLKKECALLDTVDECGFRPHIDGITFIYKNGMDVHITEDMADKIQKTFEHWRKNGKR